MSWILTHQCRFQSRTHQQYCVNISKQSDTSVQVKQLTGSEHPFTTSEANGDDIFMPVRQQTGHLRILDNSGGTLVDELLPENNTQKMVTLVNLTTGATEWIGFLAAEVFTQPWSNELTELELTVRSALACLSDVTMQTAVTGTNRLAMLVHNAFTSMFGEGQVPFTHVLMMDDFFYNYDALLIRANFELFYKKETIKNDNTETVIKVGRSYKDALEALCATFGMTLRQQGTTLIFGRYDNSGYAINLRAMTWDILAYIYNKVGAFPDVHPQGQIITRDLLSLANFRGKENKMSFIPGGRAAIVTLNLESDGGGGSGSIITLPKSAEQTGGVASAQIPTGGEYVQGSEWQDPLKFLYRYQEIPFAVDGDYDRINFQHLSRNSGVEIFNCRGVTVQLTGDVNIDIVSGNINIVRTHTNQYTEYTAADVINRSIFGNMGKYYTYNQVNILTGALPGRYSKGSDLLQNCLLLVQDVDTGADTLTSSDVCYLIQTAGNVEMTDCYININFDIPVTIFSIIHSIQRHWASVNLVDYSLGSVGAIDYVTNSVSVVSSLTYNLVCKLYIVNGNNSYHWNGSEWMYNNSATTFLIPIKGTSIVSNYDIDMGIGNVGGYLAKVEGTMTGKVVFEILNNVVVTEKMKIKDPRSDFDREFEVYAFPYQKIITDLEVSLVYSREITDTGGGENVYRRTIMDAGFSEDKTIDLEMGTNNNNAASPSLMRTYGNDGYVGKVSYLTADGQLTEERPEMHLLGRLVNQYRTMRRTMEAKIETGLDLFRNRFSYNGKLFMAIDKKHDWEREEQEVKFIEVN